MTPPFLNLFMKLHMLKNMFAKFQADWGFRGNLKQINKKNGIAL